MPMIKTRELDKDDTKDRDRTRKAGRSSKKSLASPDLGPSSPTSPSARRKRKDSRVDPDGRMMASTDSPSSSRASLPYPSFSKAHSKEAVARDVKLPSIITPDPTDVGGGAGRREKADESTEDETGRKESSSDGATRGAAPPSPPLTATTGPVGKTTPKSKGGEGKSRRSSEGARTTKKKVVEERSQSWFSRLSSSKRGSELASRTTSRSSPPRPSVTKRKSNEGRPADKETSGKERDASSDLSRETESTLDSDATSLARDHPQHLRRQPSPCVETANESSSASVEDSLPRTPPQTAPYSNLNGADGKTSANINPGAAFLSPQPPPPPPPPTMPLNIPKVDYLLQNGGLIRPAPRTLLAVAPSALPTHSSNFSTPSRTPAPAGPAADTIFTPFQRVLQDYHTVLSKNGSIAVATGYKSVARRLLDRLENVFARNISAEGCTCVICQTQRPSERSEEPAVGWGEVLEWVSGRRELPIWPAFDFAGLGAPIKQIDGRMGWGPARSPRPSQESGRASVPPIDADVPEEFHEHYVRQSQKTMRSVDQWLTAQPETAAAPPIEVDDETLTFTILTHLSKEEQPLFSALLSTPSTVPAPPGAWEAGLARSGSNSRAEVLVRSSVALQRLYRLTTPPRDPETAVFLLKQPTLHPLLAALASINSSEWDVLTSGRFDGFLWSGAEDPSTMASPWPASRNSNPAIRGATASTGPTTPLSGVGVGVDGPARSSTPFHVLATAASHGTPPPPGPPVPHDEETEIATLAEVEREIYVGMEALEDAFEALHRQAEEVRTALRERGAGLSMATQARRQALGIHHRDIEVVAGTPARSSAMGMGMGMGMGVNPTAEWESESEAGWAMGGDASSEVWPDDSASNVSSSRMRRPKRRTERRTPALVEEDSGEDERR
ncbi:MAG: hypothetical protein M1838_000970 [Thelocarpon superellum]|nr:MAG: hypothetical protein M1838_000970 [Thelocarpon superellum]